MLTRAGVAKYLGKSIATVRRLEGRDLFPRVDKRGVHRFYETEVSCVRDRLRAGILVPAARGKWLRGSSRSKRRAPPEPTVNQQAIESSPLDKVSDAKREVAGTVISMLSERELRRMNPEVLEYLEELLEESCAP